MPHKVSAAEWATFEDVWERYYWRFSRAQGAPLSQSPGSYRRFQEAVESVMPLLKSAETEDEFDEAIAELKEVLELKLMEARASGAAREAG